MNPIGATIVKTKGRGKTPSSVLVFDLVSVDNYYYSSS